MGKLVSWSGLLAALRVIFCEGDAASAIVRNCVGGHLTKWQFYAKGLASVRPWLGGQLAANVVPS